MTKTITIIFGFVVWTILLLTMAICYPFNRSAFILTKDPMARTEMLADEIERLEDKLVLIERQIDILMLRTK